MKNSNKNSPAILMPIPPSNTTPLLDLTAGTLEHSPLSNMYICMWQTNHSSKDALILPLFASKMNLDANIF